MTKQYFVQSFGVLSRVISPPCINDAGRRPDVSASAGFCTEAAESLIEYAGFSNRKSSLSHHSRRVLHSSFLRPRPNSTVIRLIMTSTDKPSPTSKPSLSYKDAGVDIDAGNELVNRIKSVAKRTRRPEVMAGLGGFGALCELPKGYQEPVLVAGTDGVGTKLRLAMQLKQHSTIGIDLVAMCVNDLIVGGAEPLMFLDYYATGKLDVDTAAQVVNGIGTG